MRQVRNMPRSNSSVPRHRRHRKILKLAKGYYGTRSRNYRTAKDAVIRALTYSYRDRRQRKRQFRRLWITRINAAARQNGVSYSRLMRGLSLNGIQLNRKILADLAVYDPGSFAALVKTVSLLQMSLLTDIEKVRSEFVHRLQSSPAGYESF